MNVKKEARRDAEELARSAMFYGEGAGVRRRLIQASTQEKLRGNPAYARELTKAIGEQDMAAHAAAARAERRRIDRNAAVKKNTKGLLTGNYQSVQSGVLVAVVVAYFAHETGYDKVALAKAKEFKAKAKARYDRFRQERTLKSVLDDTTPKNY